MAMCEPFFLTKSSHIEATWQYCELLDTPTPTAKPARAVSLPKLEPCCEGWQLCVGEEDVEALEDGTWALRYPNSIFTA